MKLADLIREFQILLEKHRQDPDDEQTWLLLDRTRREMEIAHGLRGIRY